MKINDLVEVLVSKRQRLSGRIVDVIVESRVRRVNHDPDRYDVPVKYRVEVTLPGSTTSTIATVPVNAVRLHKQVEKKHAQ